MAASDIAFEKGLPANQDAERFVLGSILMDDCSCTSRRPASSKPDDFSLEKHRRIFQRMGELHDRGEKIDRVTVANELMKQGQLEACDGLSYLVSLDDGLPADRQPRQLHPHRQGQGRPAADHLRFAEADRPLPARRRGARRDPGRRRRSAAQARRRPRQERPRSTPSEIIDEYEGGLNAFLDPSKRIKGISTGFVKLDEMTGGLHAGELFILAARPSMGKTALALNIAQHVASNSKQTVAVFSLEMSKESLLTRMFCSAARVDSQRFRAGYLGSGRALRLPGRRSKLVRRARCSSTTLPAPT